MGLLDYFRRKPEAQSRPKAATTLDNSAALVAYLEGRAASANAMHNMAVLRCVSLICESVGMLPLNLIEAGPEKRAAREHPAYKLVKYRPNTWQTPQEFKTQLQLSVLEHGNGYAQVVRSGQRPAALVPLDAANVEPVLTDAATMQYRVKRSGDHVIIPARDMLHLRDLSTDGIIGMSRMKLAGQAIALARMAERAAARVFETGILSTGALEVPNQLSEAAYDRLRASLDEDYGGAGNAGKWMLLEEGTKASPFSNTAAESQHVENRDRQIEEIARAFGVPRPLLMMDDTSWGSGIEQLGIFFVQYGLQHWFTTWEQGLARVLLDDRDLDRYSFKFNERALMRGTLKDQADFFAKALGSGGHGPWMTQNEVRDLSDLPVSADGGADSLRNPLTDKRTGDAPAPAS